MGSGIFPGMVISVVKVVLIPVLLGILLRRLIGRHIEKLSGILPLISVVSIVMIISGIVAVNAEKIMTSGFLVLCIVILHNLAGMGLGLLAGRIFHVEYDKATALRLKSVCRTAVLLSHSPPQTLLQTHLHTAWSNLQCMAQYFRLFIRKSPAQRKV